MQYQKEPSGTKPQTFAEQSWKAQTEALSVFFLVLSATINTGGFKKNCVQTQLKRRRKISKESKMTNNNDMNSH